MTPNTSDHESKSPEEQLRDELTHTIDELIADPKLKGFAFPNLDTRRQFVVVQLALTALDSYPNDIADLSREAAFDLLKTRFISIAGALQKADTHVHAAAQTTPRHAREGLLRLIKELGEKLGFGEAIGLFIQEWYETNPLYVSAPETVDTQGEENIERHIEHQCDTSILPAVIGRIGYSPLNSKHRGFINGLTEACMEYVKESLVRSDILVANFLGIGPDGKPSLDPTEYLKRSNIIKKLLEAQVRKRTKQEALAAIPAVFQNLACEFYSTDANFKGKTAFQIATDMSIHIMCRHQSQKISDKIFWPLQYFYDPYAGTNQEMIELANRLAYEAAQLFGPYLRKDSRSQRSVGRIEAQVRSNLTAVPVAAPAVPFPVKPEFNTGQLMAAVVAAPSSGPVIRRTPPSVPIVPPLAETGAVATSQNIENLQEQVSGDGMGVVEPVIAPPVADSGAAPSELESALADIAGSGRGAEPLVATPAPYEAAESAPLASPDEVPAPGAPVEALPHAPTEPYQIPVPAPEALVMDPMAMAPTEPYEIQIVAPQLEEPEAAQPEATISQSQPALSFIEPPPHFADFDSLNEPAETDLVSESTDIVRRPKKGFWGGAGRWARGVAFAAAAALGIGGLSYGVYKATRPNQEENNKPKVTYVAPKAPQQPQAVTAAPSAPRQPTPVAAAPLPPKPVPVQATSTTPPPRPISAAPSSADQAQPGPKPAADYRTDSGESARQIFEVLGYHAYPLGSASGAKPFKGQASSVEGGVDATPFASLHPASWYQEQQSAAKFLLKIYDSSPSRFDKDTLKSIRDHEKVLRDLAAQTDFSPSGFRSGFESRHGRNDVFGSRGVYNFVLAFGRVLNLYGGDAARLAADTAGIKLTIGAGLMAPDQRFARAVLVKGQPSAQGNSAQSTDAPSCPPAQETRPEQQQPNAPTPAFDGGDTGGEQGFLDFHQRGTLGQTVIIDSQQEEIEEITDDMIVAQDELIEEVTEDMVVSVDGIGENYPQVTEDMVVSVDSIGENYPPVTEDMVVSVDGIGENYPPVTGDMIVEEIDTPEPGPVLDIHKTYNLTAQDRSIRYPIQEQIAASNLSEEQKKRCIAVLDEMIRTNGAFIESYKLHRDGSRELTIKDEWLQRFAEIAPASLENDEEIAITDDMMFDVSDDLPARRLQPVVQTRERIASVLERKAA